MESLAAPPSLTTELRCWVKKQHTVVQLAYKILVAGAGLLTIIVGLLLVPLPGPGWLIVFAGVAVLGLEFPAASRLNNWAKKKMKSFMQKVKK